MPMIVHQAPTVNIDAIPRRIPRHQIQTLLKVLIVTIDPLPLIAPLGHAIKLLRPKITLWPDRRQLDLPANDN